MVALCAAMAAALSNRLRADSTPTEVYRQSLQDARWTGPIITAGANTLPPGHFLVEPYVFDVITQGRYDDRWKRHAGPGAHTYGSLTYLLYGLVDDVTVGLIPRVGYNTVGEGLNAAHVGLGDFMVQGQYRFARFREGSPIPTMSVVLAQTLPTGKYDRLGTRPSNGLGSGAYTTTLSLYSQYFLWMPNGRIVRARLNLSYSESATVDIEGVSVYGTGSGFRGHANPGATLLLNSAWEYSLTQRWVPALDVTYQHNASTALRGFESTPAGGNSLPVNVHTDSGPGEVFTVAPAIEYNWSSTMGVIAGAIFTPAGKNVGANTIPVVAVNMVF